MATPLRNHPTYTDVLDQRELEPENAIVVVVGLESGTTGLSHDRTHRQSLPFESPHRSKGFEGLVLGGGIETRSSGDFAAVESENPHVTSPQMWGPRRTAV